MSELLTTLAETKDQLWHHLSGSQDQSLIEEWLQCVHERRNDFPDWLYRELTPTLGREHDVYVVRPWSLCAYADSMPRSHAQVILVSTVSVSRERGIDLDRSSSLVLIHWKYTVDA